MKYAGRLLAAGGATLLLSAYPTDVDSGVKSALKKLGKGVATAIVNYDSLRQVEEKRQKAYLDSLANASTIAQKREAAKIEAERMRQMKQQQYQRQQAEARRQTLVHPWMDEERHYAPDELMTAQEVVRYIDGLIPTTQMTVRITKRGASGGIGDWVVRNDRGPIDFDSERNVFTYGGMNASRMYDQYPYTLQFTKFGNLQTVDIPRQENVVWYINFLHNQDASFSDTFYMLVQQTSPYLDGCGEVGLNVSGLSRGDLTISQASISGKGNGRKFAVALYHPTEGNALSFEMFQNEGSFMLDNFQTYLQFEGGGRIMSRESLSPKGKPWKFLIQKSEPVKTSAVREF